MKKGKLLEFWGLLRIPVRRLLQREPCCTAGFQLWSERGCGGWSWGGWLSADKLCRRCELICCKMFHHRHFVSFARCRRRANPLVFCLCCRSRRRCCRSPWRVAASEESPTLAARSFSFQKLWNPQTPPARHPPLKKKKRKINF